MKKVIALMGKAGSGKDTILQKVVSHYPEIFNPIISCTSRPMREGEQEGVNYYFLTDKEFEAKIDNDDMLENTSFNGWYYGITFSSLSDTKVNIGVLNPAGIRSLMRNPDIKLEVYYVLADDKTRLLRQLQREENPDVHEIIRRFTADEKDFTNLDDINFIELRNNYYQCLNDIPRLIRLHSKLL